jgi:hypothetical protein
MNAQETEILELVKANQEAYLTAYRIGYEQGWQDALNKAIEVMKKPPEVTQ